MSTDSDATDERETFVRMARDFPVRTTIFTFGLPLFALVQLFNGLLHGGSLVYIALFSLVVVAYSVVLTRYQIAAYRRQRVTSEWTEDGA